MQITNEISCNEKISGRGVYQNIVLLKAANENFINFPDARLMVHCGKMLYCFLVWSFFVTDHAFLLILFWMEMQNCIPNESLHFFWKCLLLWILFFFDFYFLVFRSFVPILIAIANVSAELWWTCPQYLCIYLNHNFLAQYGSNEMQLKSGNFLGCV